MNTNDLLKTSIRLVLGVMFIVSAILKLISIDTFEVYIYSFKVLNFFLSELAARGIIMLELMMGALLILKIDYKWLWRISVAVMVMFTFFLMYVAIFRNDENCHCFGDLISIDPATSIVKNVVVIALFLLIRNHANCRLQVVSETDEASGGLRRRCCLSDEDYPLRFKKWCYAVLAAVSFICTCVLFPPNNIYAKIFGQSVAVAEQVFEKAYQDSSLYLQLADMRYDEKNDTVLFQKDTTRLNLDRGNYLIGVMSASCPYCKQSCALLNGIFDRNGIAPQQMKILIWGIVDEQFAHFARITQTWQYEYRQISPILAIDMVNGSFPTFLFVQDGKIIKTVGYRGLSEKEVVSFLKPVAKGD